MDCPDCGAEVETGVPAVTLADRCRSCRWMRVAGVGADAGAGAEVRPNPPPRKKLLWFDRDDSRCVMCGRTREELTTGIILGAHGGICKGCVEACCDILRSESTEPAQGAA